MNLSKLNDVVCKDIILVNVVCKMIDVVDRLMRLFVVFYPFAKKLFECLLTMV